MCIKKEAPFTDYPMQLQYGYIYYVRLLIMFMYRVEDDHQRAAALCEAAG